MSDTVTRQVSSRRRAAGLVNRLIWRLYAPIYDVLCRLVPYQDMLSDIAQAVAARSGARVLDLGCGTGNAAAALRSSGRLPAASCYGYDASPAMLSRARRKCPWLTVRQGSLDEPLPFDTAGFEVVVASNVLYTLRQPELAVAEMLRVVRPGGQVVITTPCHDPRLGTIVREHVRRAGLPSLLRRLPALLMVGVLNLAIVRKQQFRFFTEAELRQLMPDAQITTTYAGQVWLAVTPRKEG